MTISEVPRRSARTHPVLAVPMRHLASVAAATLALSACGGPTSPVATEACPTPRTTVDDASSRPVSIAATFVPDSDPRAVWDVGVDLRTATGSPAAVVGACQVLDLAITLLAPQGTFSYGTPAPGHVWMNGPGDASSIHLVDQPTYITEADDGSGAQDYGGFTGWYITVEEPRVGDHYLQQDITWHPPHQATRQQVTPDGDVPGTLDMTLTVGG